MLATSAPSVIRPALLGLLWVAAAAPALAQSTPPSAQPVVPQVERRELSLPRFPSNDFEIGLFGGPYATQNFGASLGGGLRLGYHITEDWFVEAALGKTTVSDDAFRRVLPGGVFTPGNEKLQYTNLSAGLNVLPGEVFFGSGQNRAMPSSLFIIGGVGTTRFNGQRAQTYNLGLGMKVFVRDWFALRADMRDHLFTVDLLGKRESTHNLELSAGFSFLF
ncbi:outer membrane beta-barrel domain-containing protein [Ideonella sp.]|uniref:outer membrane beta-barrel domain-containing protein n=1 Tax=Ideonella sp. TaxID=1929293 RepID=UPI003BB72076